MQNEMPNPVNHGVLSTTGTVAAEAGAGGLKGMLGGAVAIPAFIGAGAGIWALYSGVTTVLAAAAAVPAGAVGAAAAAATAGAITTGILGAIGTAALWTLGTTAVVAIGGTFLGIIPAIAGLGAIFGLAKGASNGASRVSQEQGAANQMSAQISAMQAQAAMAMSAPVPENKYNLPPRTSSLNAGGTTISDVQYDGRVGGERALQLA